MAISVGFSTGEGSGPILSAGQHACILKSIQVVEQKKYQSEEFEEKIQFSFEALKTAPGADGPGRVSVWCGLNYGPKNAKLTELLDSIFGRSLTQEEVRALDIEALAGVVKGYVLVVPHTKQDGTRTTKFGSFLQAPGQPVPVPTDFPLVRTTSPNAQVPLSQSHASRPAPPPDWKPEEEEDLGDPFSAQEADGKTTEQQGAIRRAA